MKGVAGEADLQLQEGEILYDQGAESEAVYIIRDGHVDIQRQVNRSFVTLQTLGPGEVVGEMGVLRGRLRSTRAVAHTDAQLAKMSRDGFFKALESTSAIALPLMRMLGQRLDSVNAEILERQPYGFGAPVRDIAQIAIRGGDAEASAALGGEPLRVRRLPFTVGRTSGDSSRFGQRYAALAVATSANLVEGTQFALAKHRGRLVIQDFGAAAPTVVDGEPIMRFRHAGTAGADFGTTEVRTGTTGGGTRFLIEVT